MPSEMPIPVSKGLLARLPATFVPVLNEQLANWDVDFKKTPWKMGVSIAYDAEKERFKGKMAKPANKMLHRKDRAGFEIPKVG